MLGKTLLDLDDVARRLDEDFEPNEAIREHVIGLFESHMRASSSPRHLLSTALETAQLFEHLPRRMNKVLDALAQGEFTFNVEGIDESELMRGIQKLANRVVAGAVVGSMLLAAAIFSISHSGRALWGYPIVSIVLLLLATFVALCMVFIIKRQDLPQHRNRFRRNGRRQ